VQCYSTSHGLWPQWCRKRGCRELKRILKSLDLVKIWAKSRKIRAKSTKIWKKLKTIAKSLKDNEQNWRTTCFTLKKWPPKSHENLFSGGHSKNGFHEKIFAQKVPKHFWAICGNSGKHPLHPQTFACSYTYAWPLSETLNTHGPLLHQ